MRYTAAAIGMTLATVAIQRERAEARSTAHASVVTSIPSSQGGTMNIWTRRIIQAGALLAVTVGALISAGSASAMVPPPNAASVHGIGAVNCPARPFPKSLRLLPHGPSFGEGPSKSCR